MGSAWVRLLGAAEAPWGLRYLEAVYPWKCLSEVHLVDLGFSLLGGGWCCSWKDCSQGQEKSVYGLSVCRVPPQGPSPSTGLCEVGMSILD